MIFDIQMFYTYFHMYVLYMVLNVEFWCIRQVLWMPLTLYRKLFTAIQILSIYDSGIETAVTSETTRTSQWMVSSIVALLFLIEFLMKVLVYNRWGALEAVALLCNTDDINSLYSSSLACITLFLLFNDY